MHRTRSSNGGPLAACCLALGCASAGAGGTPIPAPTVAATTTPVAVASTPPELDDRPAAPLPKWRQLDAEAQAAIAVKDVPGRIAACKAFVAAHPDHERLLPVVVALVDAMVDQGGFDAAELARLVELRAGLEPDKAGLPLDLIRDYHLAHGLPRDSGQRLIELTRTRLGRQLDDLAVEPDPDEREDQRLRLRYTELRAWWTSAQLALAHGDADAALADLAASEKVAAQTPQDVLARAGDGKDARTYASGGLDTLHVLTAAARLRKGEDAAAKAALSRALGFLADVRLRELFDRTRDELGVRNPDERIVKAELAKAQPFVLEDLDGKKVALADLRGKVVLVAFWATWCGPCKKELPELVAFAKAHADKGVVLLAVSIDSFDDRAKIKPFLRANGLDMRVLLEKPEQLGGYNYSGIPALYVVDRQGRIAHARTGFDPQLEAKLDREIREIVDGKRDTGRELFTLELAPAGFDVRWQTAVTGDVNALTIAGGPGGGELAFVGRDGLTRFGPDGSQRGAEPLAGYTFSLEGVDLDGDGTREWVRAGWPALEVLDGKGGSIWDVELQQPAGVSAIVDLDGDGSRETVMQQGDRVLAYKSVPKLRWKSRPLHELEAVVADPSGGLVVQADGELVELDARGQARRTGVQVPPGRVLAGRMATPRGEIDLFKAEWSPAPRFEHDVDGDGRADVLIASDNGVVVYDADGDAIVRLRSGDVDLQATVGELDGKPGAEIAVAVAHYGVVVLGRKP